VETFGREWDSTRALDDYQEILPVKGNGKELYQKKGLAETKQSLRQASGILTEAPAAKIMKGRLPVGEGNHWGQGERGCKGVRKLTAPETVAWPGQSRVAIPIFWAQRQQSAESKKKGCSKKKKSRRGQWTMGVKPVVSKLTRGRRKKGGNWGKKVGGGTSDTFGQTELGVRSFPTVLGLHQRRIAI